MIVNNILEYCCRLHGKDNRDEKDELCDIYGGQIHHQLACSLCPIEYSNKL